MTISWLNNEEKETGRVRKEAVLGKSMQEVASQWLAQPHPSPDQPQPSPGRATLPHHDNSPQDSSLQAGTMRNFPGLPAMQKAGMVNLKSSGPYP